jgi:hypothetical protein
MAGELLGLRAHFHLIAIAVALSGSWLASSAIRAANFDSDCCADLELRVAELEATTARKGNKKVSVQVYGKINRMVEFWDDAAEKNTYVT